MGKDGLFTSLSLVGAVSLCCLGLGGLTRVAAVSGGAATTVFTTGATDTRGAVVSGLVTAVTVLVVGLVAKRRLGESGDTDG